MVKLGDFIENIWISRKVVKVTVKGVMDKPGLAAYLFQLLSELGVNAEMLLSGPASHGRTDLAFLIMESQWPLLRENKEKIIDEINARDMVFDPKVALIVIEGKRDMSRVPGIAYQILNLFGERGINIELISSSLNAICLVIREDRVDDAIEELAEKTGITPKEGYYW